MRDLVLRGAVAEAAARAGTTAIRLGVVAAKSSRKIDRQCRRDPGVEREDELPSSQSSSSLPPEPPAARAALEQRAACSVQLQNGCVVSIWRICRHGIQGSALAHAWFAV